jgi:pimeloyl-ACP methyl ester carboxylesterase
MSPVSKPELSEPRLLHVSCLDATGLHRMAYWEWGDPQQSHVVVCAHGLSRQGRDFDVLARALSPHVRVICPDVVGRGQSDWLVDPMAYQLPTYVADMFTLLARLNAKTIDWVGTSMGGLIGMGVASRLRAADRQSMIRRLVINDVGPTIDPAGLARIATYVGRPSRFATLAEAATYVQGVSETFGPHTPAQWLELTRWQYKQAEDGTWVPRGDAAIGIPFKSVTPAMAKMGETLTWMAYDAITSPTLLVRGALSDLLSPHTAQQMTQRGPKARLVEVPGVGHAPMFQQPDQVDIVTQFLLAP